MHLYEEPCRFSESRLWALQRAYYAGAGIEAWSKGDVPADMSSHA